MVHEHSAGDFNRAFAIGVGLNVLFVVVETGFGISSGSLALLADAGHNLVDVFSLLLAWGAGWLATRSATTKRTYGFGKGTVMASLASAIMLLVAMGGISWEALGRLLHPEPVTAGVVIVVAAVGVVINAVTAMLFFSGQKEDLNIKGAFLHMAADAAVSLGVVIAGILIMVRGWLWIDPVISLVIAGIIMISTWGLFRDSFNYAMDAVPDRINLAAIEKYLENLKDVVQFHDLHVWPLSTREIALTVHLVVNGPLPGNRFLADIQQHLHDTFAIDHVTIQVEQLDPDTSCMLDTGRFLKNERPLTP